MIFNAADAPAQKLYEGEKVQRVPTKRRQGRGGRLPRPCTQEKQVDDFDHRVRQKGAGDKGSENPMGVESGNVCPRRIKMTPAPRCQSRHEINNVKK